MSDLETTDPAPAPDAVAGGEPDLETTDPEPGSGPAVANPPERDT